MVYEINSKILNQIVSCDLLGWKHHRTFGKYSNSLSTAQRTPRLHVSPLIDWRAYVREAMVHGANLAVLRWLYTPHPGDTLICASV